MAERISEDPIAANGLRLMFALLPIVFVSGIRVAAMQASAIARWNVTRAIQPVSYFIAIVLLAAIGKLSVASVIAALLITLGLQALGSVLLDSHRSDRESRSDRRWSKGLLTYGLKNVAIGAPWLLNSRLDQLVLSLNVPMAELGNYVLAVSLSLLAAPFATAFGSLAFPRIAASEGLEARRRIGRAAVFGSLGTAAALLLPMAAAAPLLIPAAFGSGFAGAVVPLVILVPGTIAFVGNQVMADVLRGLDRPMTPALAEGIGVLITVALLILLVPTYGIRGAAVASVIAYLGVFSIESVALRGSWARAG
jgi:O-antigen/teichoic acid export membrane protein